MTDIFVGGKKHIETGAPRIGQQVVVGQGISSPSLAFVTVWPGRDRAMP
jgi:hypothetical protein